MCAKILYVTPVWTGLRDILVDGATKASGMPAFVRPLQFMIEAGHSVDFVAAIADPCSIRPTEVRWLKNVNIYPIAYQPDGMTSRIRSILGVRKKVNQLLSKGSYDFVYGHGPLGALASMAANRQGIPNAQRLYGTFLADELSSPRWKIASRHPLEYQSFRIKKNFLLCTNDGTRGDDVHRHLAKKDAYEFHFLRNGVDPFRFQDMGAFQSPLNSSGDSNPFGMDLNRAEFLIYPARLDRWKRQDRGIELLKWMHKLGYRNLHLICAGQTYDRDWKDELLRCAEQNGVSKFFHHLERLEAEDLTRAFQKSIAVLSFYDLSNLGNVVLEALASGALVVARCDGSLDQLIKDGENGVLAVSPREGAEKLSAVLREGKRSQHLRENAQRRARKEILTWDARAKLELDLIENAI